MASGMTYTMTETTALSTAEYYGKALCELGAEHPEVVALTADLGKSTKIGMFGEKFPDPLCFYLCYFCFCPLLGSGTYGYLLSECTG